MNLSTLERALTCSSNTIRHLFSLIVGSLVLLACSGGGGSDAVPAPPMVTPGANGSTVLVGGTVVTMNGDNDVVEAIAYNESGEIIAVGSESDVVAQAQA